MGNHESSNNAALRCLPVTGVLLDRIYVEGSYLNEWQLCILDPTGLDSEC